MQKRRPGILNLNQGPPHLDELFRRFFARLKQRGANRRLMSSGRPPKSLAWFLSMLAFVAVMSWFVSGFYILRPNENAAVFELGRFQKVVTEAGTHWLPTGFDTKQIIDLTTQSLMLNDMVLTKDQYVMSINAAIDFQVSDVKTYALDPIQQQNILKNLAGAMLTQALNQTPMLDLLMARYPDSTYAAATIAALNTLLAASGLKVVSITLISASVPQAAAADFARIFALKGSGQNLQKELAAYVADNLPQVQARARQTIAVAQATREKIILDARAVSAQFLALLPAYQKDPQALKAYLKLTALSERDLHKTSANTAHDNQNTETGGNDKAAYLRWKGAQHAAN